MVSNELLELLKHAKDGANRLHVALGGLDAAIKLVEKGVVRWATPVGAETGTAAYAYRSGCATIPFLCIPLTPPVEVTDLDKKLARVACVAIYKHHDIPYSDDDRLVPVMEAIAKERADEEARLDDAAK